MSEMQLILGIIGILSALTAIMGLVYWWLKE